ncbi:MAG: glucose-6-phosphate dehydrogenase (NADP(+)) [Patescibacteria group bacterium]|nr:glucose-6-phosphate dehydrogenase (NADP(+)) [Patescibacteria group bacterium]
MNNKPTILIIIGISGDLSKRKLLPAIGQIGANGKLPDYFKIVGVTRQSDINLESLLQNTINKDCLRKNTEIFQMDIEESMEYRRLQDRLNDIEKEFGSTSQYLFYFSVPPKVTESIIKLIGESDLLKHDIKLLLEKPFGTDLKSAKDLIIYIDKYFKKEQVYRIDHYLAKEAAQNIIIFRDSNSLFKKTWNKNFIKKIEISVSEEIGIEGRVKFYEQTGALRDLIQSHLLQLLALVIMDIPENFNFKEIPHLRYKALSNLHLKSVKSTQDSAIRGQYIGYREEVNNLNSMTETFASINLESDDPNWKDVDIKLTTGKALDKKFAEIKILYKKIKTYESNELLINLQPNEKISLGISIKSPGYDYPINSQYLNFSFNEKYGTIPDAYEQVLFDAIKGNFNLFVTSEEILETWRILDQLQKIWLTSVDNLILYNKGSSINDIIG